MSLGRKATIGAGWMIVWRAVSRLLGVANTLILARLLVPADFGLVAMAMTFETSLLMMAAFPVQDALLRRPESDSRLYDAAFTIQAARALALAILIAAGAPIAAAWFSEPRLTLLVLALSATTAINGLANIGVVEFQRELRFDVQFRLQLLPAILQALATIGTAWLTHSYWALIAGLAVMRVAQVAMTYAIHPYRPRISLAGWRHLVGFSFWLWLASLAAMVWGQVDAFVVGPVFGSAGLGLYQVAGQAATLPTTEIVEPVSAVLFAGFAYAQREGRAAATNPLIIALALLLLLAPMALVISADSRSLVAILLGAKWAGAAPLVAVAAAQCLFQPFVQVARAAQIARGYVRAQFMITAAAAVLRATVVTLAAMTKSLEMVVVATIVALAGNALLYTFVLQSRVGAGLANFLGSLVRIAVAVMIAAFALIVSGLGWSASDTAQPASLAALIHLGVVAVVVSATYTVALLAIWLVFGRPSGPEKVILNLLREFALGRWLSGIAARATVRSSS